MKYLKSKFSKNFINISWSSNQIFFTEKNWEGFNQSFILKNDFESQNFAIFEEVVHNYGRSDDDMI